MEQRRGKHPLYVSDLGYNAILRCDLLTRVGALWDFGNRPTEFLAERTVRVRVSPCGYWTWATVPVRSRCRYREYPYTETFTWAGRVTPRQEEKKRLRAKPKNRAKLALDDASSEGSEQKREDR